MRIVRLLSLFVSVSANFLLFASITTTAEATAASPRSDQTEPTPPNPGRSGKRNKTSAQRLYDDLFGHYNADLRPTTNDSDPVNVSMHLWFKQVLKVDEIDQILTIYCWTETYWQDDLLTWDPKDYDGVSTLRVPSHRIWRPDILVYNNADMNINENEISTNAVLNHTGHITNFRAIITKVTCNLEMTYFPFDQQTCNMMFASWSYDGSKVFVSPAKNKQSNLEYYIENTEWKLLNFSWKPNVAYYDCCPEPYPDITYSFILERNPSYYILNLIIPSVFITVVTMVGFFTPYSSTGENTEKVSLGVTALLSLAIILLMVADKMPATSKVIPLIGKYYIGLIWLIFAATIITTVTLRLQSKGNAGKPLSPDTKRLFFHYIARVLFMKVDLPPTSFEQVHSNNGYNGEPSPVVTNGGILTETALLLKNDAASIGGGTMARTMTQRSDFSEIPPSGQDISPSYTSSAAAGAGAGAAAAGAGRPAASPEPLIGSNFESPVWVQSIAAVAASRDHQHPYMQQRSQTPDSAAAYYTAPAVTQNLMNQEVVRELEKLRLVVRAIDGRLAEEQELFAIRKEWEQLSRVCERMLMMIFVFITVLFAVFMLHSHESRKY